MDHQIAAEDHKFMRWLDSNECEQYWVKVDNAAKVILGSGWDKAQTKYNRIKRLKNKIRKWLVGL